MMVQPRIRKKMQLKLQIAVYGVCFTVVLINHAAQSVKNILLISERTSTEVGSK